MTLRQSGISSLMSWPEVELITQTNKQTNKQTSLKEIIRQFDRIATYIHCHGIIYNQAHTKTQKRSLLCQSLSLLCLEAHKEDIDISLLP